MPCSLRSVRGRSRSNKRSRHFLAERGITDYPPYVAAYKQSCVQMVPEFVVAELHARDTLAEPDKRGIPTAILTNGWSPLQQYKARHAGFTGQIVVSADIGAQKPQPQAFHALCRTLGTPASQTAYVGDSPESDVAVALAAGMFAVWFDAENVASHATCPSPRPLSTTSRN